MAGCATARPATSSRFAPGIELSRRRVGDGVSRVAMGNVFNSLPVRRAAASAPLSPFSYGTVRIRKNPCGALVVELVKLNEVPTAWLVRSGVHCAAFKLAL